MPKYYDMFVEYDKLPIADILVKTVAAIGNLSKITFSFGKENEVIN